MTGILVLFVIMYYLYYRTPVNNPPSHSHPSDLELSLYPSE